MASPNMLLRDPILYRIRHARHYRTGDEWCIYPLYDFAHPIEDALECVTHSICTLEFENNRPLYDWVVEHIPLECRPHQYEFARRNLDYTVMSKRKLLELVRGGLRERLGRPAHADASPGCAAAASPPRRSAASASMVGVAKTESRVDIGKLEYAIRDDLNQKAPRVLCVLEAAAGGAHQLPGGARRRSWRRPTSRTTSPREGSRPLPFSRELYIDRDDFAEDPPKGFYRLVARRGGAAALRLHHPLRRGGEGRERARWWSCAARYDPDTRGGTAPDGRTVKGTIQWVSAEHARPLRGAPLRPALHRARTRRRARATSRTYLNPESLVVRDGRRGGAERRAASRRGAATSSSGWATSAATRVESTAERAGLQPHGDAARHLGEGRRAAEAAASEAGAEEGARRSRDARPAERRSRERRPGARGARARPSWRRGASATRRELGLAAGGGGDPHPRPRHRGALRGRALPAGASAKRRRQLGDPRAAARGWRTARIENLPFGGPELGELVALVEDGTLSSSAGARGARRDGRRGRRPGGASWSASGCGR